MIADSSVSSLPFHTHINRIAASYSVYPDEVYFFISSLHFFENCNTGSNLLSFCMYSLFVFILRCLPLLSPKIKDFLSLKKSRKTSLCESCRMSLRMSANIRPDRSPRQGCWEQIWQQRMSEHGFKITYSARSCEKAGVHITIADLWVNYART